MKKMIIIIILAFSSISINSQFTDNSVASRYVKLANTYINAEDFNSAIEILKKADMELKNRSGWDAEYWRAATNETYGVLFMKMKMPDEARKHFQFALDGYTKLVSMPRGSQEAVAELMKSIESIMQTDIEGLETNPKSRAIAGLGYDGNVMNYDNLKLDNLPNDLPANAINLSLAENKLKEIPSSIYNYKNLKYVNLSNNRIGNANMPNGAFKSLIWLDLSNNKIKKIPETIENLQNIEFLDLSNNRIKELPVTISNMKKLKVLNLKGNRIPFSSLKQLLQSMPSTNILHDEYIRLDEEETEEE